MIRRVVKVGGSLFDLPDLESRFRQWLQSQPRAANVVVGGGGSMVDAIRSWQRRLGLDDVFCHWLSIDAMSISAKLLHHLISESAWTRNFEDLPFDRMDDSVGVTVFDCVEWLKTRNMLPESWDVTSDSIAADLAQSWSAHELVLLKASIPREECANTMQLAEAGFVDGHFPIIAAGLAKIRIVNLGQVGEEIVLVAG